MFDKIEKTFLAVIASLFFLLIVFLALYAEGMERVVSMQQMIEVSGASSDSEVEEVGELYGIKPTLRGEYNFWEVVAVGARKEPSDIEIANVIAEIKTLPNEY